MMVRYLYCIEGQLEVMFDNHVYNPTKHTDCVVYFPNNLQIQELLVEGCT